MALTVTALDMMKGWVEDLAVKNRDLEEENKSLKLRIVTLTQQLEMEKMSNGRNSVNVETQVEEVSRIPGQSRKVQSDSAVDVNNGKQILRTTAFSSTQIREVNPEGRPKRQRRVKNEMEVYNDEEIPRVGEGSDPCLVERNPLKILEEALSLVLSYLGKHDLLNTRLVSHAWNDESLKVLRKSKFTQRIRGVKIKEYLRFTAPFGPYPFIIPFHVVLDKLIPSSDIDSLCQTFGPKCVSSLELITSGTYWTEEDIKKSGLFEFSALISPGLRTLNLAFFYVRNDFLRNQNQIISFPNLKKFICNTFDCESGSSGYGPCLTYISIIENSPILEDLTLIEPCDLDSWPLNFNQLKYLSVNSILKPQNILDRILACSGPPVLRELSFGLRCAGKSWSADDKTVVYNILESVSQTLKSLILCGYLFFRNIGGIMRFPKLPHLEHLGLEYDEDLECLREAEYLCFSQEKFPSLKSIELPLGLIFTTPSPVQSGEDGGFRTEFPLIKITLRVGATSADGLKHLNRALEQLQNIFPIPSKLSMLNVGWNDCVKYLLDRILKSNWSKSTQEIEMIGFHENYTGEGDQFLSASDRVNFKKYYEMLEKYLKTNFQYIMKSIRMECGTFGRFRRDSIILTRANQSDCENVIGKSK